MRNLVSLVFILLSMTLTMSCGRRNAAVEEAEQYLTGLNDNQAKVLLTIDGKQFYPQESVFNCQFLVSRDVLNVTLTDQFDGRTILQLVEKEWYARHPIHTEMNGPGQGPGSLKIGKLTDRVNLVGEGYMMTSGSITALTFDQEKVIFEIEGQVGKYSDFQTPDHRLPLKALIICKRPAMSLGDITEKEIFGFTHSN